MRPNQEAVPRHAIFAYEAETISLSACSRGLYTLSRDTFKRMVVVVVIPTQPQYYPTRPCRLNLRFSLLPILATFGPFVSTSAYSVYKASRGRCVFLYRSSRHRAPKQRHGHGSCRTWHWRSRARRRFHFGSGSHGHLRFLQECWIRVTASSYSTRRGPDLTATVVREQTAGWDTFIRKTTVSTRAPWSHERTSSVGELSRLDAPQREVGMGLAEQEQGFLPVSECCRIVAIFTGLSATFWMPKA
ncbi:hypothetical protein B0J13DRAFT_273702 [Dactylonectria estremocensis]|uniref:Uncharacterized protein n=1 Tax=Dactylonectria estremocensis TaxID=1079267 RepID=A0A9P9I932_9HYPO|nr:hypothetical protein B0J13DRAFT_273702 [Dactylonectria estremocensis]